MRKFTIKADFAGIKSSRLIENHVSIRFPSHLFDRQMSRNPLKYWHTPNWLIVKHYDRINIISLLAFVGTPHQAIENSMKKKTNTKANWERSLGFFCAWCAHRSLPKERTRASEREIGAFGFEQYVCVHVLSHISFVLMHDNMMPVSDSPSFYYCRFLYSILFCARAPIDCGALAHVSGVLCACVSANKCYTCLLPQCSCCFAPFWFQFCTSDRSTLCIVAHMYIYVPMRWQPLLIMSKMLT